MGTPPPRERQFVKSEDSSHTPRQFVIHYRHLVYSSTMDLTGSPE